VSRVVDDPLSEVRKILASGPPMAIRR
jgi:hypothetical protein